MIDLNKIKISNKTLKLTIKIKGGRIRDHKNYWAYIENNEHISSEDFDSIIRNFLTKNYLNSITNYFDGILFMLNKKTKDFLLINDSYGVNTIYYTDYPTNQIHISDNYNDLIINKKLSIDSFAFLDLCFFNYTLLDRTFLNGIKRLRGAHVIVYSEKKVKIRHLYSVSDLLYKDNLLKKPKISDLSKSLINHLNNKLDMDKPILLSMTGGFDSRLLFAILKSLNIPFETFTFGNDNSYDLVPAKSLSSLFDVPHHFLDLSKHFEEGIKMTINKVIDKSFDCPFVLDLAHYSAVSELFPSSNIITGFMGGEFLTGGGVGSQVTFTEMAYDLLVSRSMKDLQNFLINQIKKYPIINLDFFMGHIVEYSQSLMEYSENVNTYRSNNLTDFLLNEKYAKFFGIVNQIYKNKHNRIDPFTDYNYLRIILNLKDSYTNISPETRSFYHNFKTRRYYAEIIKDIYPPILKTKLDRGYYVKDLIKWYGLLPITYNYFVNHIGLGNKVKYKKTLDYQFWFKDYIIESLLASKLIKLNFVNGKSIEKNLIDFEKSGTINSIYFRKLFILLGIEHAMNRYSMSF